MRPSRFADVRWERNLAAALEQCGNVDVRIDAYDARAARGVPFDRNEGLVADRNLTAGMEFLPGPHERQPTRRLRVESQSADGVQQEKLGGTTAR